LNRQKEYNDRSEGSRYLGVVAEEASGAYKEVPQVVGVTHTIPTSPESLLEQYLSW